MVFSSLIFLYGFLPLCLLCYLFARRLKAKNIILLIFSLAFYAWGEPLWIFLLLFSSIINYYLGLQIDRYDISEGRRKNQYQRKRKTFFILAVIVNLALLGFFKYIGFFIENINFITGLHIPAPSFSLPIGISFYTFQILSYIIDVYKHRTEVQTSLYKFMLFVSLFPQLIAGPILRYQEIADQMDDRRVTLQGFSEGITRFLAGLAKKVIIANYAGKLVSDLLGTGISDLAVLEGWLGILLFAIQIYFDFSGYSDMAIGLGKMFGFHYGENFNYPYISKSITDFWRRWHISLGSFFRDYLYIPLGGNRRFQIRNLLVVWFLTGLWHGASWNFVLWGLYFFVFLVIEKTFLLKVFEKIPKIFSHIYAIILILTGWVFFYFTDLGQGVHMLKVMYGFSGNAFLNPTTILTFGNNLVFILIALIACIPITKFVKNWLKRTDQRLQLTLTAVYNFAMLFICTASLVGSSFNPFLYFKF